MSTRPEFFVKGEKARLIPVAADSSKEVRATSVFLAAMMAVPSFADRMMATIGQKVGKRTEVSCFTEVVFKQLTEGKHLRPDGFISLVTGHGRTWSALVESKIGNAELDGEQVRQYACAAKEQGIDAIVTISNQFVALPSHSPIAVGKVLSRTVVLFHWSWMFIVTEAMLLIGDDEFGNAEQKFILSELVSYLSHDSTGVRRFDRMNKEWKDVVLAVNARSALNKAAPEVISTIGAWHQELRDVSLLMTRKLRRPVRQKLTRLHTFDPAARVATDTERLAKDHVLECSLDIPDAADSLHVQADLVRRCIIVSMTLSAPDSKRASSRVNWLIKQLSKADPTDIHIEAQMPGRAPAVRLTLAQLRAESTDIDAVFAAGLPTSFRVMMVRDIAGRFSGNRTFIEELERAVPEYYEGVGQHLQDFRPKPPQFKTDDEQPPAPPDTSPGLKDVAAAASEAAQEALGVVLAGRNGTSVHASEPATSSAMPKVPATADAPGQPSSTTDEDHG